MATRLETPQKEFELGDFVSFEFEGKILHGRVVRVYAARCDYHVEVDGVRYSTHVDEMHASAQNLFLSAMQCPRTGTLDVFLAGVQIAAVPLAEQRNGQWRALVRASDILQALDWKVTEGEL
jgi:hypothetical protein